MTTVFNLNRYDKIVANDLSLNGTISTALGGLSQWEDSGSDIYFSGGNVGIGTTNPSDKLTITDGNLTLTNGGLKASLADNYDWNNYGQIISGAYESNGVYFGLGVGMDVSGLTIVVGAPGQEGANTSDSNDGSVIVYRYDTSAEIWYQLGNTITGETSNYDFGFNVDINDAGTRIMATNHTTGDFVNVYDYNSITNNWDRQVSITAHTLSKYAGRISGDGNTIVFSDYKDNSSTGKQYVYRNTSGTTWTKIGEFTGAHTALNAGIGPALSYDGNRVTFPEKDYNFDADGNSSADNGRMSIYDYSGSGTSWNQVGNYFYGEGADAKLCSSCDFSKDGSIVAFGTGDGSRYAKVFQYENGYWNQLGTTIQGPTSNGYGMGVRLSDDGTVLIVNDDTDDTAGTDNGALYIYKYTNGDWVQQGSTLYSQYTGAELGYSLGTALAISGDGSKIVAGGLYADVNGTDSGYVQSWQWSQKTYTNPALDVSGRTVTMWGNAENTVANYSVAQLGSTLTGASSGIAFGKSMDMDSTGTIWAIADNYNTNVGSVRVYKYQNAAWSQMGSTINGTNGSDYLGNDISISGDGKVLILSAIASGGFYTSGGTRVYAYVNTYRYTNGDWVLFGETSGYNTSVSIVATNPSSSTYWGSLISTNNDGSVVAINEMNGSARGGIWRYDSSSDSWSNEHLFGHNATDVAMSRDGTRMVTGHEGAGINVTNDGAIRVYDYNNSTQTWSQVGSTITGYETQDRVGYRVAISGDGNTFFQCASNESSAGNSYGQVYTYVQDASGGNGDWVQKGPDFVGTTTDRYGLGSSLDYDGDTLILGAPNNDVAKVYKYLAGYWQQIGDDIDFDGSTGVMSTINDAGTIFAVGASGTTNGTAVAYNLTNNPALKIEDGNAILNANVGIGTTNPIPKVDVNGSVFLRNQNLTFASGGGGGNTTEDVALVFNQGGSDRTLALKTDSNGNLFGTTGSGGTRSVKWCLGPHGSYYFNGNNVGIGTDSPISALEVASGAASFTGSGNSINTTLVPGVHIGKYVSGSNSYGHIQITSNENGDGWIDWTTNGTNINTDYDGRIRYSTADGFKFYTNHDEKMRIDSSGRVGIGRDGNINTGCRLHVASGSGGGSISIVYIEHGDYVFNNTTTSANNTSIVAEDDVVVGGAIGLFSDRRIKQNILEIDDASSLEKLRLLKPSYYNYKDKVMKTSEVVEGFIAQEVREVLPYAVKETTTTIPNIFLLGTYQDDASSNSIITIPDFNTSNLERDASGNIFTRLKLYIERNNENKDLFVDIEEVISSTQLKVCVDESQSIPTSGNIFIYGQEVNNFCHLQKDRIFTIATSALQEVDRQLQAEKANVVTLETKIVTLETQVADLLTRVSALENAN